MNSDICFDTDAADLDLGLQREWLETNGLGGWASSTVAGAHTRRYHGLLVVATQPPVGRMVLLSKVGETLVLPQDRVELDTNLYPGAVHPQGHRHLESFSIDPYPVFTYAVGDVRLRKSVCMIQGEHTVVVSYELLQADAPLELEVRPFFAGRDYHHLGEANGSVRHEAGFADGVLSYQVYEGQPTVRLSLPGAVYDAAPGWYYNHEYPREAERGLDAREDLFSCGVLHCTLQPGEKLALVCSTEAEAGRDGMALVQTEMRRRAGETLPPALAAHPLARHLATAAGQCLVRRGDKRHTILAGYHWFTDWGRDTMIALPGVCLVTGRYAEARGIFRAFVEHISEGMIPNRFPDAGEHPDYNTVDATLWFFTALYKYVRYSGDYDFAQELWTELEEIIAWHQRGTRYGIRVEADGLLAAGEEGAQLTWMDAKVGDWVVTPRQGKAVEINALWYNALRVTAHLAERFGQADKAQSYGAQADQVKARFEALFWNAETGCLYDVVEGERRDGSIRPNQVMALSLPFPLLDGARALSILQVVEEHLLTPRGLRSLSSRDPAYRGHYGGAPLERDGAYHQGTVWGWLIGPFLTALSRLRGEEGRRQAGQIVAGFADHLKEAGLGSVSEIFDGEAPHAPRGCIAQAWSVAELLRAYWEDVLDQGPKD
jgi:predicted glycogen debranching enzyme